jgi:hypothetical protein
MTGSRVRTCVRTPILDTLRLQVTHPCSVSPPDPPASHEIPINDLEDGESLARSFFSQVTRHDFVAELRVPSKKPIADYVRSLSGTSHGVDQERVAETVAADFPRTAGGHYVITSHSGCLVCQNG